MTPLMLIFRMLCVENIYIVFFPIRQYQTKHISPIPRRRIVECSGTTAAGDHNAYSVSFKPVVSKDVLLTIQ